jgi:hypothetical protein
MVMVRNQSLVCQSDQATKSVQNYAELRTTRVDFGTARRARDAWSTAAGGPVSSDDERTTEFRTLIRRRLVISCLPLLDAAVGGRRQRHLGLVSLLFGSLLQRRDRPIARTNRDSVILVTLGPPPATYL